MIAAWNAEGEPENLTAASADALEWLALMARLMDNGSLHLKRHSDNRTRLGRTGELLYGFIKQMESEQEGERRGTPQQADTDMV